MSVWRATVRIDQADLGGSGSNTWHCRTTGEGIDINPDLNGLMGIVEDFYTACAAIFPDDAAYVFNGEFQGVGEVEGESRTLDDWTTVGAVAGQALPPANCICVGWRTGSGGRMGKGRTFLGPIHANGLDTNGTPTAQYLATVRTAAQNLVEASDSFGNGALGVWSNGRPAQGGNPAAPPAFRDFTSTATRNVFAVLRSRRD